MSVREARSDISLCHLSSFDQMRIDRKFGTVASGTNNVSVEDRYHRRMHT